MVLTCEIKKLPQKQHYTVVDGKRNRGRPMQRSRDLVKDDMYGKKTDDK